MTLQLILKTMVLSYLDYGSMFLTVRTLDDILSIQVLQNKALRACLRIRNYMDVPVHDMHLEMNVQPYDKRMQYFLLCSVYRNIKSGYLVPIVPVKRTRLHRAPVYHWPHQTLTGFLDQLHTLGYKPRICYLYVYVIQ